MVKSMILDHCWVCGTFFIPKGPAHEEQHHIVPRAYGGEDGPVVSLCDSCHTRLHKAAISIAAGKQPDQYTLGLTANAKTKVLYLASCAANAKLATLNDPNKKSVIVIPLTGKETQQIDALKRALRAPSRAAVIKAAIYTLYTKHFSAEL